MHHHHQYTPFDDGDENIVAYLVSQGSGRRTNMTALWITMILFVLGSLWLVNRSLPVSHEFDPYPGAGTSSGR